MARRARRTHQQMMEDLQKKITELELKAKARELGKDPAVKSMRMVRMHLRKACGLAKAGSPFSGDFVRQAQSFLDTLDAVMVQFGARKPRKKRKQQGQ